MVAATLALSACATSPTPSVAPIPALGFDFPVDCGPIENVALCRKAVEIAATEKRNPPPIAEVRIRLPRADDDCMTWFHECGAGSIMVGIQSGDTVQDVPLIRTSDTWVPLDLVR